MCVPGNAVEKPHEVRKPLADISPLFNEMPVKGCPMPIYTACKIAPHPCEVYSSRMWKYTQPLGSFGNFIRRKSMPLRRICLIGNAVCISSRTQDVIERVVDLAEEALCLNGCYLTINRWIITLPEGKLSEWKSVSGEVRIHCRQYIASFVHVVYDIYY